MVQSDVAWESASNGIHLFTSLPGRTFFHHCKAEWKLIREAGKAERGVIGVWFEETPSIRELSLQNKVPAPLSS